MQWLNTIVDELIARHSDGEILIESGSAPSGPYHLGHLREFLTPDAILMELRRRGKPVRHVHFVDDLDGLRKIPKDVPSEFEKYLGVPLCDIPAPDGSDVSYAEYFLRDLQESCKILGIDLEFLYSHQKYRSGFDVPAIESALTQLNAVRKAVEASSGRELPDDWAPVQFLETGRFKNRRFLELDTKNKLVYYQDPEGSRQQARYDKGEVKLDWRLDWPARWWLLGVDVEAFGRDHASAGGSYDTGEHIMRDVYKAPAPLPVPYDFINMVGDTKKMSASKGTGLGVVEASLILPPEVLRYFVFRASANKRLHFDPIHGVVQLMDDFAALVAKPDRTESEEQLLYICTHGKGTQTVSRVPFSHLVASYQASLKDADKTLEIITRTEYADIAKADADIIRNELKFIDAWLEKRAPEDVKFSLLEQVNAQDFSEAQRSYFAQLADKVAKAPKDADGEWFHKAIYEFKDSSDLPPKELFTSLYQLLIGKTSGPRAGWFLSLLPREWLVGRLRLEGVIADVMTKTTSTLTSSAKLTDAVSFVIDDAVLEAFPEAVVGYLVADIPSELNTDDDPLAGALEDLKKRGITAENLSSQPEIAAWRKAFSTFGVKPSKYLSSVEALAKRALKDKPARVSAIVDTYNAVSLKNLVPMGAFDLDKLQGDIVMRYGRAGESALLLGMDKLVEVEPAHIIYADERQTITWLWNHRDAAATAVSGSTKHAVFFADSLKGSSPAEQAIEELGARLKKLGVTVKAQGLVGKA